MRRRWLGWISLFLLEMPLASNLLIPISRYP
jgi:hypothetical protein